MLQLNNKPKNRYFIRIPKEVTVIYCNKKNILYILGPKGSKSLRVNLHLTIFSNANIIFVSGSLCDVRSLNLTKKKVRMIRGLIVAKIKQLIVEVTGTLYKKLKLLGVGYRAFPHDQLSNQIYFKLGFSHLIYYNIPSSFSVKINKFTDLYIYGGNSIDLLSSTVSKIRNLKAPEPYKGKGILYDQEKIVLKKGKKI